MAASNVDLLVLTPIRISDDSLSSEPSSLISEKENKKDGMDNFNHPRVRRIIILQALLRRLSNDSSISVAFEDGKNDANLATSDVINAAYEHVHTAGLLTFLTTAWQQWDSLGDGQDPLGCLPSALSSSSESPPLIPGNIPLQRDPHQRPSSHVMGQIGYYCTDTVTPVFGDLLVEMQGDATMVLRAVQAAASHKAVLMLPTHPGHHSSADCYGGYCYTNHAAAIARKFQQTLQQPVAVLDVDYHAGNGTASIFYDDPTVLVVSLHCDPNFDYPFHSGFAEENNDSLKHFPLPPRTTWKEYQVALTAGLDAIVAFGAGAVVVSLGLDTYDQDPCAIRRAGFCLADDDYKEMGQAIAKKLGSQIPVVFMLEGGYRMDRVGEAATDVVLSFVSAR